MNSSENIRNALHVMYKTYENVEKLMEMIKYFVCNSKSIFPTKLNKEMFYADFYHYKRFGISISGLNYQAIQFGPVPVHYNTTYDNIDGINCIFRTISVQ